MRRRETNRPAVSSVIAGLLLVVSVRAFAEPGTPSEQTIVQSRESGKIAGRVRVEGRFEKPAPLKVYKNRDFCGAEVPNESLLVGPDGGLQNAVVILYGARSKKKNAEFPPLVLDNKNCAFVPHVQVASLGSEILLLNSDPILHDVHARIGSETLFNVGLPTWRQIRKRFNREGIVAIECDVLHTWMSAYILVTSSPYYAVTDERGEFSIEEVPAGSYKMEIWHEKLGIQLKTVNIRPNHSVRVDIVYRLGEEGG